MTGTISEIDEQIFLSSPLLYDAIFDYGDPELLEKYDIAVNAEITRIPPKAGEGIKALLDNTVGGLLALEDLKAKRAQIINELKNDILAKIRRGDLIPVGFQEPRNIHDKPIKIPADLFFSAEINWDNSEIKSRTLEFSGIRVLSDLNPIIDLKSEIINSDIPQIEKPKKLNFLNLDPELHIDEKKAAEFIGISYRTLQGYRVKGGGPEYIKIGKKAVRYKIQDLINWVNSKKKQNTSQN